MIDLEGLKKRLMEFDSWHERSPSAIGTQQAARELGDWLWSHRTELFAELERLRALFRQSRSKLFNLTKYRDAHEREWESESQEAERERLNQRAMDEWNRETEKILNPEV